MFNMLENIKTKTVELGHSLYLAVTAPTARQLQLFLFVVGVGLLTAGLISSADAQGYHFTTYNDSRLVNALNAIFTYIEGAFGAMVMVAAGVGAIMSAAFGQYKAALGLLVVAVGAFVLRSFVSTFFNDTGIL